MTENKLTQNIISTTYTHSDLRERLELLREFLEKNFFTEDSTPPDKAAFLKFLSEKRNNSNAAALTKIDETAFAGLTKENLYKAIERIAAASLESPTIKLTLAVRPSPELIGKLGNWLRSATGDRVFLDIETNPNILGGCIITHKSQQLDYSVAKTLKRERVFIRDLVGEKLHHSQEVSDE